MSLLYRCDACKHPIFGEPALTVTGGALPGGADRIDLCEKPECAGAGLNGLLKGIRPAQRITVAAAARAVRLPANLVKTRPAPRLTR